MKVGLFFGSFNPIHMGHMIVANIVKETTDMDQIWFIVSPQNPFKKNKGLLHEFDRIDMVREAINDDYNFQVSDVEFSMPRPSYTVDTMAYLVSKYPSHSFQLIIGEDNLESFTKWKNYEVILEQFGLLVYPRPHTAKSELRNHPSVTFVNAPEVDISATFIRYLVQQGKSIKYLVPEGVRVLIETRKYYQ